jgi:hypothetical protein
MVEEETEPLVMPAIADGALRYRIRLNPKSWRKTCAAAAEAKNPFVLIIKGKLGFAGSELLVQDAGVQLIEKAPKEDKPDAPPPAPSSAP